MSRFGQGRARIGGKPPRLDALKERGADAWRDVEDAIGRRTPAGYKEAIRRLRDLQMLAERERENDAFNYRLKSLRKRHSQKKTLISMLEDLA